LDCLDFCSDKGIEDYAQEFDGNIAKKVGTWYFAMERENDIKIVVEVLFWKCGTVQIFGNDCNKSKPDSGGN
jgi:hypothetical protein